MITSEQIAEVFTINPPTSGDPCEITQLYGMNAEWYADIGLPYHNGIDFRAKHKTPIYAVCDGIITRVENGDVNDTTKGRYIYYETAPIMLKDGQIITLEFLNFHLWESLVKVGDNIEQGEMLSLADNTGRKTTGSHLHFGAYPLINHKRTITDCQGAIDPMPFLNIKDTIMKLYKEDGNPAVYQKGVDGKFHPIVYERFAKDMYGDWDDIHVEKIVIPDSQKGFPVGFYLN